MSKKHKEPKDQNLNKENLGVQNPPAEQDKSAELSEGKENDDMNLKKVRRNALQFVGDVARKAGDGLANFKADHPVADKVIKVTAAAGTVATTVVVIAGKILSDKDEEIVDGEAEDVSDIDEVEDLDTEDDEVEETSDTDDDETEESEEETSEEV